jgi:arabinan endo-1,5-alpha-L-arabinosidase
MPALQKIIRLVLLATCQVVAWAGEANFEPVILQGQTFIHDPSTILRGGDRFYVFGTGPGVSIKSSTDLIQWTNESSALNIPPAWTTNLVPGYRGYAWAPDVIRMNGQYYLYYAVSRFGKQVSAIGLATNPTLNPASPNYGWVDRGPVIQSTNGSPYNAIDPGLFSDADGKLWLVFGSFWKGIFLTQLDAETGLRGGTDVPLHRLAWSEAIEAPALTRHGEFYYLFVNWGVCCRGTNSTYEVRVGRSKAVTGPYLDRDGRNLVDGGGTMFLESTGPFIGPGHVSVFRDGDADGFSYHYYDAESRGRSRLAIGRLRWTDDGWPLATARSP